MKKIADTLGIIGILMIILGIIIFFVRRTFEDTIAIINVSIGVVFLFNYLYFNIKELSKILTSRSTKYGTSTLVYILLILGIIVCLNIITYYRHARFDLTENKIYSLSDQTIKVLKGLQNDVTLTGFYIEGTTNAIEDLLKAYKYATNKLKYEFVDPDKEPGKAKEMGVTELKTIVVKSGNQEVKITEDTEQAITNAIIKVTKEKSQVVYFVAGHGEPSLDGQDRRDYLKIKEALINDNYKVEELILATTPEVPENASVVVLGGAQKPLLPEEWEVLERYFKKGGSLYIMADPDIEVGIKEFANKFGVKIGDDIIIDKTQRLFWVQMGISPIVDTYGTHPIVKDFSNEKRTVFPTIRSVTKSEKVPDGIEVTELIKSSSDGWGETNLELFHNEKQASPDDNDIKGPVSMGVAVTYKVEPPTENKKEGKLVIIGDSEFINNVNIVQFYNEDFFLNGINWLSGEEELISVRPRQARSSTIQLTAEEHRIIFYGSVLIGPEIIAIIGIWIWKRRR